MFPDRPPYLEADVPLGTDRSVSYLSQARFPYLSLEPVRRPAVLPARQLGLLFALRQHHDVFHMIFYPESRLRTGVRTYLLHPPRRQPGCSLDLEPLVSIIVAVLIRAGAGNGPGAGTDELRRAPVE